MLNLRSYWRAFGASNAVQLHGNIPSDKERLIAIIDEVISRYGEKELKKYRMNLKHL